MQGFLMITCTFGGNMTPWLSVYFHFGSETRQLKGFFGALYWPNTGTNLTKLANLPWTLTHMFVLSQHVLASQQN